MFNRFGEVLRAAPVVRCAVYMLSLFASIEAIFRLTQRPQRYQLVLLHIYSLPAVLGLTKLFQRFNRIEPTYLVAVPTIEEQRDLLKGAGLALGAGMVWTGIATTQGWLDFKTVETQARSEVLEACVYHGFGNLAVAINEEVVLRGFMADTLNERFPQLTVELGLSGFFALMHGTPFTLPKLLAHSTMGGTMVLLRRMSGSLWMPIGYYWLWNVMKLVIINEQGVSPALFPFKNRGPQVWIGRAGTPHVGLLDFVVFAGMFGGLFVVYKRQVSTNAS